MKWWQWLLAGFGVLVLISALGDQDDDSGRSDPTAYERALDAYHAPVNGQVEAIVDTAIDNSRPNAICGAGSCTITYNGGSVLGAIISPQEELFEDQRSVWEGLFSEPSLKSATLTTLGKAESVGGKSSTVPVLRITCDRADAEQINWNRVDVDGIETICEYAELVRF